MEEEGMNLGKLLNVFAPYCVKLSHDGNLLSGR
jgi:hypothetical protein